MFNKVSEKGQALILIAFAAIGLFAFAALAIDGSRVYSEKRHAQNAADTAVMAAALAYTRDNKIDNLGILNKAQTLTTANGYDNNGETNEVTVEAADIAAGSDVCPGKTAGKDITVTIVTYVETTFARVIGRDQVTAAVTATSRACGLYIEPLFGGNAIVGLNPNNDDKFKGCGFDSGESNAAHWKVEGSGIFSNGCVNSKDKDAVLLDEGSCVTAVGGVSPSFDCTPTTGASPYPYPEYVDKKMPANPCDGTPGDIGITPSLGQTKFTDGVYCISNMEAFDKQNVVLDNATLYVTDMEFSLKYAGDGGFYGTPTEHDGYTGSAPYEDYYMIIVRNKDNPCVNFTDHDAQVLQWRGNGEGSFYGTIFAPSACLDLRGNGDSDGMHSQIIGYTVSSNGNAGDKDEVYINYKADENHQDPVFPTIAVLR